MPPDSLLRLSPEFLTATLGMMALLWPPTETDDGKVPKLKKSGKIMLVLMILGIGLIVAREVHDRQAAKSDKLQIDRLDTRTETLDARTLEINAKIDRLLALKYFAKGAGQSPVDTDEFIAKEFSREVRGERIFDMEGIREEIGRLEKETGFQGDLPDRKSPD